MYKHTNTYRTLTVWLLAAVFANLFFPAAMEAAQLFCKESPFEHSTGRYTSSSCWMDTEPDNIQSVLNQYDCSFEQICAQAVKSGLSETPVGQHQNILLLGAPTTGSTLYTDLKKHSKTVSNISPETVLPIQEIYLLNSTLLN